MGERVNASARFKRNTTIIIIINFIVVHRALSYNIVQHRETRFSLTRWLVRSLTPSGRSAYDSIRRRRRCVHELLDTHRFKCSHHRCTEPTYSTTSRHLYSRLCSSARLYTFCIRRVVQSHPCHVSGVYGIALMGFISFRFVSLRVFFYCCSRGGDGLSTAVEQEEHVRWCCTRFIGWSECCCCYCNPINRIDNVIVTVTVAAGKLLLTQYFGVDFGSCEWNRI